jgi:hypothetical protein
LQRDGVGHGPASGLALGIAPSSQWEEAPRKRWFVALLFLAVLVGTGAVLT